ncbi:hypothetical protein P8935_01845 [Telmatobacter sp. DSM 110680]|uniref:DUF3592 domain-containing protein n=2 Tax=Telmatobacter sp. DSM 110680 TaxID=3036704 RepID=A0AAU7DK12_9BACT
MRRIDRWPETAATVTSTDRFIPERWQRGPSEATIGFCYTPDGGEIQSGQFRVDDGCSLFNVDERDTFPIRYDPAHPERYFSSEFSIRSRLKFLGLLVVGFVAVFVYVFASFLRR